VAIASGAVADIPPVDKPLPLVGDSESAFYLYLEVEDRPGVLSQVASVLGDHGISVRSVVQRGMEDNARLVMVSHPVADSAFQAALAQLAGLDSLRSQPRAIRVIEEDFSA
jgi:homoserine dehydrogenase